MRFICVFFSLFSIPAFALTLTTEELPPFNFIRDGNVVGQSTDVMREVLKRTGIPGTISVYPWKQAYQMAQEGKDTCVYSTSRTEARESLFRWVGPLATNTWTLYAKASNPIPIIKSLDDATKRQHTPKLAFVAPAMDYVASSGKKVNASDIDLLVRAVSMGKLHHAMMGTASVAVAVAACIPGTLVNAAAGGGERCAVRFGHPSGTLRVGAEAARVDGEWGVKKAVMSRSARVLMEGFVRVSADWGSAV